MLSTAGTYIRRHHWGMLALICALGGTSYAALQLPANSVGSRQIRRDAVTLAKIDPRARASLRAGASGRAGGDLTGRYPNPSVKNGAITSSKLAPIPAATRAVYKVYGCGPVGCIDWLPPRLPYTAAAFYRDNEDIVHLSGGARSHNAPGPPPTPFCGNANLDVIFVLPQGDRPATRETFAVDGGNAYARVDVTPDGQVICMLAPYVQDEENVSLDGITFRAGG